MSVKVNNKNVANGEEVHNVYMYLYVYTKVSEIVSEQRAKRTVVLLREEKKKKKNRRKVYEDNIR